VRRWRAELALIFNTLIWGATFVVVQNALEDVSTLLFIALRFGVASLALWVLFRKRLGKPTADQIRGSLLCGVFLFLGYALQTFGLRYTSAPKSAFITGLSIALVPLMGAAVYRIRPRIMELAGVGLSVGGMGLMTLEGVTGGIGRGDLLTMGCAVGFACHILAVGHYSGNARFELLSLVQVVVCAMLAAGLFWWAEVPRLVWRPATAGAVLLTGLVATALAFTVQSWAQQYTTPTRTALIFTLEPLFAWGTSYVIAGETLSGRAIAGAFLILGGVLLVELKPGSTRLHPSE